MHIVVDVIRYTLAVATIVLVPFHWRRTHEMLDSGPLAGISDVDPRAFVHGMLTAGIVEEVGLAVALVVNTVAGWCYWAISVVLVYGLIGLRDFVRALNQINRQTEAPPGSRGDDTLDT